jgi:hypothetical protein
VCRGKRRGDSRLCRNSVRRNFRDREGKNRGRCGIWDQEMIRENIFFKCNITRNENFFMFKIVDTISLIMERIA